MLRAELMPRATKTCHLLAFSVCVCVSVFTMQVCECVPVFGTHSCPSLAHCVILAGLLFYAQHSKNLVQFFPILWSFYFMTLLVSFGFTQILKHLNCRTKPQLNLHFATDGKNFN